MEEVEETKREDSTGAGPSRRKPACAEELTTAGDPNVFAEAVRDSYCVDAGGVEQHECGGGGWLIAGVVDVVTELMRHA